jgi:hypothetical protein
MLRPTGRHTAAAGTVVAVVAVLLLGGCSDDPLERDRLDDALLTGEDLGSGWAPVPDVPGTSGAGSGEDDASPTTCLAGAGELADLEPTDEVSVTFAESRGSTTVANGVATYDDVDAVTEQLDRAYEQLRDCQDLDVESATLTYRVDIETERSSDEGGVDDRIDVHARGSYTAEGHTRPFFVEITVARVGPNLTTVQTIDAAEVADRHTTYAGTAVDRLVEAAG